MAPMACKAGWVAPAYVPLPSPPKLRLFCLPWAGGSSSIYSEWPALLEHAEVEVVPIELPGRSARVDEEPYADLTALAADLAAWLVQEPRLLDAPFAVFGHSFGGLCAYELCAALAASGRTPALLLVSAAPAPQFAGLGTWPVASVSGLSDEGLAAYLAGKGNALPAELREDPELAAPFLRAIRADYAALEAYREGEARALPCPVQVFGGHGDIEAERLEAWRQRSARGGGDVRMHDGGHFYIQSPAQRGCVVGHIAEAWDRIGEPEEDTLRTLQELARSALRLPASAQVENLAEAGADSLECVGLAAEIRVRFGVGLAPDEVIRRPLARHLARYIDICLLTAGARGPPELVAGSAGDAEWHPVSYQQEQMIVMYEVSKSAYNMPTTLHWRGPLDVQVLRKALHTLVAGHGTLRTIVRMGGGGEMQQRVLDASEADQCFELCELHAATAEHATKVIEAESTRVFDLEKGPMFRATVIDSLESV
ncbi:unnamed protein product [Prorocentrum cordatum]|uniref:Carrier domain-containing protein n=1 Tax=Prorocentrum cordatum TaxID=2364126 RepID=A0ABN9T418_9DINO|nr:unnamed protein product [Polarella glacialis]